MDVLAKFVSSFIMIYNFYERTALSIKDTKKNWKLNPNVFCRFIHLKTCNLMKYLRSKGHKNVHLQLLCILNLIKRASGRKMTKHKCWLSPVTLNNQKEVLIYVSANNYFRIATTKNKIHFVLVNCMRRQLFHIPMS